MVDNMHSLKQETVDTDAWYLSSTYIDITQVLTVLFNHERYYLCLNLEFVPFLFRRCSVLCSWNAVLAARFVRSFTIWDFSRSSLRGCRFVFAPVTVLSRPRCRPPTNSILNVLWGVPAAVANSHTVITTHCQHVTVTQYLVLPAKQNQTEHKEVWSFVPNSATKLEVITIYQFAQTHVQHDITHNRVLSTGATKNKEKGSCLTSYIWGLGRAHLWVRLLLKQLSRCH